ncbi:hypothetical protein PENSPDRAFT_695526 [Peniophora sp. CONT]|nr:hypothetical protein PENSPDRAFT_695526 [Peniophora sp. CONT]
MASTPDDDLDLLEGDVLQDDDKEESRRREAITLALLVALLAADANDEAKRQQRAMNKFVLHRADLLSNPRGETTWTRMYDNRSDSAFITTMGVNVKTFHLILNGVFAQYWNTTPIPCPDTSTTGPPRPHRCSLDAVGALGLALHYLCSTAYEISLQQMFALIPATTSCYILFSLAILLKTLRGMEHGHISWPVGEQFEQYAEVVRKRHGLLYGAFGSVDGLNLACQVSADLKIENACFNGWLHNHYISSVIVFNALGMIIWAKLNCPGSWHDSRIALSLHCRLRDETLEGYYLVADSAFPRGSYSSCSFYNPCRGKPGKPL